MRGRRSEACAMASPKLVPGSKQEDVKRGKARQAQDQLITRYLGVSVAGCAPDGAGAPGQELLCASTNPARLSPPKALARQCSAKSALSALVIWERRWQQTSWPPDDG